MLTFVILRFRLSVTRFLVSFLLFSYVFMSCRDTVKNQVNLTLKEVGGVTMTYFITGVCLLGVN